MAELLAKTDGDVSLYQHCVDVLRLGHILAERLGLDGPTAQRALLACALHDIGKATESFQAYLRGEKGQGDYHALASFLILLVLERRLLNHTGERVPGEFVASAAVLSHHSPLHPSLYESAAPIRYHPNIRAVLEELLGALADHGIVVSKLSEEDWRRIETMARRPAYVLHGTSGRSEADPLLEWFRVLDRRRFGQVKAVLHLADWLASGNASVDSYVAAEPVPCAASVRAQLRHRIRPFQAKSAALGDRSVLYLQAPTGVGKTEAALLWAGSPHRLIYLLPTQATTNAMWCRLRRLLGENRVGLAHGHSVLELRSAHERSNGNRPFTIDDWLFDSVFARPVTVATLDQYLLAHLHGRHWEVRLTLSRSATVIVDEVHAYEPYTLGILAAALETDPPKRLAVLSATLPSVLRERLPAGVLLQADDALWRQRRHRLRLCDGGIAEMLDPIVDAARHGQRVLVVVNTVREAQELFDKFRSRALDIPVTLLHSRFTQHDRRPKEDMLRHAPAGSVLIATQVVEVSLDISYDVLFTELAPLDAIVQRMGRVNRYGEKDYARVWVCTDVSERSRRLYGEEVLRRSRHLLEAVGTEPDQADLRNAVDELYGHVAATQAWISAFEEGRQLVDDLHRILGTFTVHGNDQDITHRFGTRRGTFTIRVLPDVLREKAMELHESGQTWRIRDLTVPVPYWWTLACPQAFYACEDLKLPVTRLAYCAERGLRDVAEDQGVELEAVFL